MTYSSLKYDPVSKQPVITVALITSVCVLGDAMLYIVLPIYWKDFGLAALWQIGVLLSINRFIRLPLNPLVGWLYARYSKRSGLLVAVMLASLTTFSYGILHSFWALVVARCFWGVAWSLLRLGGFLTVIDTATDENRDELIGIYNGLWGLGLLGGMLIGGWLADLVGIVSVTTVFSLMALMSIPFVYYYVPVEATKKAPTTSSKQPSFRHILRQSSVWSVLAAGFIMAMVFFGVFTSTLSRMIDTMYGKKVDLIIVAVGAATLSGTLQALKWCWEPFLAPFVGRLTDRYRNRHFIFSFSLAWTGASFILTSLIKHPWAWLFVILVILLFSTIVVTLTDALASDTSSQHGKVVIMTTYTVVTDVGAATGPLFAYVIGAWLGFLNLYILIGCLLIGFASVWSIVVRQFARNSNSRSSSC